MSWNLFGLRDWLRVLPGDMDDGASPATVSSTVRIADVPQRCTGFAYGELQIDGDVVREETLTGAPGEEVEFTFEYDAAQFEGAPSRVSVLTSTEIECPGSQRE